MPKFLIQRNIPGLGQLGPDDLQKLAERSRSVLYDLGPHIQWLHSYVTADKLFCVYIAPSEHLIREHARCGAFPVNDVTEIASVTDMTTAELRA